MHWLSNNTSLALTLTHNDKNSNAMKKVINILVKRKSEIDKEFQKMPKEVDQYIAEIASELQEEERQIDQALLVLSDCGYVFGRLSRACSLSNKLN
jgi:membrane-anchored protein YejM (alkaline phosphatase superfamily)